jgi:prevent-host-death family protein
MVMKASRPQKSRSMRQAPRRLGVAEAKARFAELLRDSELGATVIHNRGRDVAVVLSMAEYDALAHGALPRTAAGPRLIQSLAEWRARSEPVDFQPERIRINPQAFRSRAR